MNDDDNQPRGSPFGPRRCLEIFKLLPLCNELLFSIIHHIVRCDPHEHAISMSVGSVGSWLDRSKITITLRQVFRALDEDGGGEVGYSFFSLDVVAKIAR